MSVLLWEHLKFIIKSEGSDIYVYRIVVRGKRKIYQG